jgi:hypothetical protein
VSFGRRDVFADIAARLRELARTEIREHATAAERFKVVAIDPLALDQVDGDIILEEGDPDLVIGAWLQQYREQYGLPLDTYVIAIREDDEWHALDVDPASPIEDSLKSAAAGAFSAFLTAASSVASGAVVPFDTEEFDVSGYFDPASHRFTPGIAGIYRLTGRVTASAATDLAPDQMVACTLRKNGVALKGGTRCFQRGTTQRAVALVDALVQANGVGDYFDVTCGHDAGGNLPLGHDATTTYFQGELVGRV